MIAACRDLFGSFKPILLIINYCCCLEFAIFQVGFVVEVEDHRVEEDFEEDQAEEEEKDLAVVCSQSEKFFSIFMPMIFAILFRE